MRVLHLAPGPTQPSGIAAYASHFVASLRRAGVDVQQRDVRAEGVGSLDGFSLVHAELGCACRDEFRVLEHLARTREVPFVATLHDPPWFVWRPFTPAAVAHRRVTAAAASTLMAPRARRVQQAIARAAEGLLVMSEAAMPATRRTLGLNGGDRLCRIHYPRRLPPRPAPPARGQDDELVAGFHGFWFGGKGIELLVDAVALLRDDARPISVRLWGESPPDGAYGTRYRDDVLRRIRARGVGHLVTLGGAIAANALDETLREAHVIVLPHRSDPITYRGLKSVSGALEDALGAGVPVIASDVRAFAEQIRQGVDGLLVAPDDPQALATALRRLRDEPGLLARLQAGAATPRDAPEPGEVARALYEDVLG